MSKRKKLSEVVLEKRPSTTTIKSSTKVCVNCAKPVKNLRRCRKCKSGCYCSRECCEEHGFKHGNLCTAIQDLENLDHQKKTVSVRETNQVFIKNKLVRLVGEKPILNCLLDGKSHNVLWDTGSMVSLVDEAWLRVNFPDVSILSIHEFLEGDNLQLCAANNTNVSVEGVAVIEFGLSKDFVVLVPFLSVRNS